MLRHDLGDGQAFNQYPDGALTRGGVPRLLGYVSVAQTAAHPARGIRLRELTRTDQPNELDGLVAESPVGTAGGIPQNVDGEPARDSATKAGGHGDRPGEVPGLTVGVVVERSMEAATPQPIAATGCRVGQPERPPPHPGRMPQLREEPPTRVPALGEAIDRFGEGGAGVHHVTVRRQFSQAGRKP